MANCPNLSPVLCWLLHPFFESPVYLVHHIPHGMNVIESPRMSFLQHLSLGAHVLATLLQRVSFQPQAFETLEAVA